MITSNEKKKPAEHVLGLVSDAVNATHWIYTDSSLFELKVNNETRDLWHFYMTQGDYEKAMKYASVSAWLNPNLCQFILRTLRTQCIGILSTRLTQTHSLAMANISRLRKSTR